MVNLPATSRYRSGHPFAWMDDVFKSFFPAQGATSWQPAVEVVEEPEGYVVTAEVPGIDPGSIEVTLDGETLTLKGEKKSVERKDEDEVRIVERRFGSFARAFTFPVAVDAESVAADVEQGVLTVRVAKAETAKPKRIEVRGG